MFVAVPATDGFELANRRGASAAASVGRARAASMLAAGVFRSVSQPWFEQGVGRGPAMGPIAGCAPLGVAW
ncbi:hypothetical protein B4N89_41400 [Embleya scabrispora]|uniref:Uncharacterized protein n=1 Tax=Embleya scabrispora TaxID=159449 RepID=A0A1T3NJT2_9ACTN|nr:hypothetical protein B4N89_41400 [Embleya scabrispora]